MLEKHNWKLLRRFEELKKDPALKKMSIQPYRLDDPSGDAEIVIVNYGFFSRIGCEIVDRAREAGIPVGQLSLKALNPFPEKELLDAVKKYGPLYAMEGGIDQLGERIRTVVGKFGVVGSCQRPGGYSFRGGAVRPAGKLRLSSQGRYDGGAKTSKDGTGT